MNNTLFYILVYIAAGIMLAIVLFYDPKPKDKKK